MTKYCVRLKNEPEAKNNFLRALGFKDEDFELDPEGNPVTVWVTTSLSMSDLYEFDTVEDVVESVEYRQNEIEELTGETLEDMGIDEEHFYED